MKFSIIFCFVFSCCCLLNKACSQNKVVILDDPIVSLQARVSVIRNAKHNLDIATYIYGNDESSSQVLREIVKAAERGIKVRMVIDALNNHIPKELTAFMISKGIRIKIFNKFSIKKRLNNIIRMHAKIIVSDHLRYIVGGRNVVNSYFYIGDNVNFRDREIFISGRSGKQAAEKFESLWFSALLDEIEHEKKFKEKENMELIKAYFDDLKVMPMLFESEIVKTLALLDYKNASSVDVIMDRPHSYKFTEKSTTAFLLDRIKKAKKSILMESPYVVLSDEIFVALKWAIKRGVKVEIVTNSMMTSDSYLVLPVYYKERDQLLAEGFSIMEFQGKNEYLHTKMFIFDNEESVIGSYNLDMLSANINTEVLVTTTSEAIVNSSLAYFYQTREQSIPAKANPLKPIILEGKINLKSIRKYAIIKTLEWTIAPYLRDYL